MCRHLTIGIDIGGTNTDAVLVDENQNILQTCKTSTTIPLEVGVETSIQNLLKTSQVNATDIQGVFVGSTHATNAILENKGLYKVGVIRIAGHNPSTLRPCFSWPEDLKAKVYAGCITINGGYECDMREISPLSLEEVQEAAEKLTDSGAEGIAVVGVFSSLVNTQEVTCGEVIKKLKGEDFPVSLSHEIGGIGFIERENASILNTALKKPMEKGFKNIEQIKNTLGLSCPLFITQNNGSLIDLQEAIDHPILTISSGPTNSFIGASKLTNAKDAVVVDIGGTSTDIGVIQNGYPRRSMHNSSIGGVSLNFRMPDVLALSIGGGTKITFDENDEAIIGPESCGHKVTQEAEVFGGNTLTMTDVAHILNQKKSIQKTFSIDNHTASKILKQTTQSTLQGIRAMKGEKKDLSVILVGGGASIGKACATSTPKHFEVANAYGAALAEVSASVDTVKSIANRQEVLELLKNQALEKAIKKGASKEHTRIVNIEIIPYHYMPNQMARVMVTASGKRALAS